MAEVTLFVNEIFPSISGEVSGLGQGRFCTFVRLAGCNLRCSYCDTPHALNPSDGAKMTLDEVIDKVEGYERKEVIITGGEPLIQPAGLTGLTQYLVGNGFKVVVETNGSMRTKQLQASVHSLVVDYKSPSSGMEGFMHMGAFHGLNPATDFIKYVAANKEDINHLEWLLEGGSFMGSIDNEPNIALSAANIDLYQEIVSRCNASPVFREIPNLFLNVQIHKTICVQ